MDQPHPYQEHLSMFVLDMLRIEDSYDGVLNIINSDGFGWRDVWGRDLAPVEIDNALSDLSQRGLIVENREHKDYYALTPDGRRAWREWTPPGEAGDRVIVSRALRDWDPIGVFDVDEDWPEDEYEAYVPVLLDALRREAGVAGIIDILHGLRVDHIGCGENRDADRRVATELCKRWSEHQLDRS